MRGSEQGLIRIVRDFLDAHQQVRLLLERHRASELRFDELRLVIGDDESSVLFRLKERCHQYFRNGGEAQGALAHREALFDLVVGSLFHEAMKFRENFYQRDVYGPRMRQLRATEDPQTRGLFAEFEKILAAVGERLKEGCEETEVLLDQTSEQLRLLLSLHRESGLVARFLIENTDRLEEVLGAPPNDVLADVHGSPAVAYTLAARSYIAGGYYAMAIRALSEAIERGGSDPALAALVAFAKGMAAYLERDWAECIAGLSDWLDCEENPEGPLARLAQSAVTRVGLLAEGDDAPDITKRAAGLASRLAAV